MIKKIDLDFKTLSDCEILNIEGFKVKEKIIIHNAQSTIFDIVKDETTDKQSIKIKTKPPYHNNIFPNVKIIPYAAKCSLALKASNDSEEINYTIDFIYHLSETSFIVYDQLITLKVHKVSNTLEQENKHYLCKNFAKFKHIDTFTTGVAYSLEKALDENDFDEIFKILSELTR